MLVPNHHRQFQKIIKITLVFFKLALRWFSDQFTVSANLKFR